MNEVALRANDVALRANDVALRANDDKADRTFGFACFSFLRPRPFKNFL